MTRLEYLSPERRQQRHAQRVAQIIGTLFLSIACFMAFMLLFARAIEKEGQFYDNIRAERCKNPAPELAGYCKGAAEQ